MTSNTLLISLVIVLGLASRQPHHSEKTQRPKLVVGMPAFTAVGHTCIFTGSVPAFGGIAGNDWVEQARLSAGPGPLHRLSDHQLCLDGLRSASTTSSGKPSRRLASSTLSLTTRIG